MNRKKYHRKLNNLQKSGTDAHGRVIVNDMLYDYASQISGIPKDMVEDIMMFIGKYAAALIESNNTTELLIPRFGKFGISEEKMVKRMVRSAQASGMKKSVVNYRSKDTATMVPAVVSWKAAWMYYKRGIFTRQEIETMFAGNEKLPEIIAKIEEIDHYKSRKNDTTVTGNGIGWADIVEQTLDNDDKGVQRTDDEGSWL